MEAVGLLAGGIAHDVNNVLNIVVGEAELLEDALPTAESLARVVAIRDAARRGAGLTHKLLTFSRQRPVVLEPLDLSAVVAGAEHLMRGAVSESVRIHVRRPADPTMVLADATLVEQLLLNLVVNAGHAMPQGGELSITVDVAPAGSASADVTAEQGGALARLRVSDTGVGMSQELLQRIWEPFFTTRELGSGLGLAIVHGAVRQMRGLGDGGERAGAWLVVQHPPALARRRSRGRAGRTGGPHAGRHAPAPGRGRNRMCGG
jgi:signal transduction histidine kinase